VSAAGQPANPNVETMRMSALTLTFLTGSGVDADPLLGREGRGARAMPAAGAARSWKNARHGAWPKAGELRRTGARTGRTKWDVQEAGSVRQAALERAQSDRWDSCGAGSCGLA
jgi:hypothetical protein